MLHARASAEGVERSNDNMQHLHLPSTIRHFPSESSTTTEDESKSKGTLTLQELMKKYQNKE